MADTLAAWVSSPVEEVRDAAARGLHLLAAQGILPRSTASRGSILFTLADTATRDVHWELLGVLERLDLPDATREDVTRALIPVCRAARYFGCDRVAKFLRNRPGWTDAALTALLSSFREVSDFDRAAFETLTTIGSDEPLYFSTLERLLDHPEAPIRTEAAILLAGSINRTERVLDVLEEAAVVLEEYPRSNKAAEALAGMGEAGVARIAALIEDPTAPLESRNALLHYFPPGSIGSNSRAAAVVLAAAAGALDPRLQASGVWALRSLRGREADVRAALLRASAATDPRVRSAVVYTWPARETVPGEFAERVFADSDAGVRALVFTLLPLVPREDVRRVSITRAALGAPEAEIRNAALRFAGTLGPEGAALLVEYARAGKELTDGFFAAVKALQSADPTLVALLEERAAREPAGTHQEVAEVLGKRDTVSPAALEHLYERLAEGDGSERLRVANELLSLNEDPWDRGGLLAAVLLDGEVRWIVEQRLWGVLDELYPDLSSHTAATVAPSPPPAPRFPWPPPAGYSRVVVPRALVVSGSNPTLGDVYRELVGAIERASSGFEHGLFAGIPGGFALVARMERIREDGSPLPGRARWMKEGNPKVSLVEFLSDLFFEKPGYFRVIAFAVTTNVTPGSDAGARLPEPEEGSPWVPADLAKLPFRDQQVLALIYSFERRPNAKIR
ncbi:MAG TPA: hypothetical protein VFQ76_01095, partial [Longimicrobiaceae bacterium]|nr:hypothetical protein [Longimicrobiaceae bacterium]